MPVYAGHGLCIGDHLHCCIGAAMRLLCPQVGVSCQANGMAINAQHDQVSLFIPEHRLVEKEISCSLQGLSHLCMQAVRFGTIIAAALHA